MNPQDVDNFKALIKCHSIRYDFWKIPVTFWRRCFRGSRSCSPTSRNHSILPITRNQYKKFSKTRKDIFLKVYFLINALQKIMLASKLATCQPCRKPRCEELLRHESVQSRFRSQHKRGNTITAKIKFQWWTVVRHNIFDNFSFTSRLKMKPTRRSIVQSRFRSQLNWSRKYKMPTNDAITWVR